MSAADNDAGRWLRQAENDLSAARLLAKRGFASQACFLAHQAAEKALKGVARLHGERDLTGHSLLELLSALESQHPQLSEHTGPARRLDPYYTWTRYPSDRTDSAPFEAYDRGQAGEATDAAERIVRTTRGVLNPRRKWWSWPAALFRLLARR